MLEQPKSPKSTSHHSKDHTPFTSNLFDSRIEAQLESDSDLLVFSHLRWDFVFQRPQHLLSRFAKNRRVYFIEEPIFMDINCPKLELSMRKEGVTVAVPHLCHGQTEQQVWGQLRELLDEMIEQEEVESFTSWYYTPMALPFTQHLEPAAIIYDCMDELSAFKGAPQQMLQFESDLIRLADLVFTGGQSLYEAKQHRHHNIHCFPSSIDAGHFGKARHIKKDVEFAHPADQAQVSGPRLGFFGVVDERFDIHLLEGIATLRPDWNFMIIGPVVKIDPASLPKLPNIHYLGMKQYQELPNYLAGWDLAMLPFAKNESTRFISPTKTPEYLAAGCPVVSTSIRDVVRPYGEEKLVYIADTPEAFVKAAEQAMHEAQNDQNWIKRVDAFLSDKSWDHTVREMLALEMNVKASRITVPPFMMVNRDVYDGRLKA